MDQGNANINPDVKPCKSLKAIQLKITLPHKGKRWVYVTTDIVNFALNLDSPIVRRYQ